MNCINIYWAAPLFNDEERAYNKECVAILEKEGHLVYLPQRDGGELGTEYTQEEAYDMRLKDITALRGANAVVAVLNGRAMDEGTVYEIGYAEALKKPVITICSDVRTLRRLNAMLCNTFCVRNMHDVLKLLSSNELADIKPKQDAV